MTGLRQELTAQGIHHETQLHARINQAESDCERRMHALKDEHASSVTQIQAAHDKVMQEGTAAHKAKLEQQQCDYESLKAEFEYFMDAYETANKRK